MSSLISGCDCHHVLENDLDLCAKKKSLDCYCKIVLMEGVLHSRFIYRFFYFAWIKLYKGTFSIGKELSIYPPTL